MGQDPGRRRSSWARLRARIATVVDPGAIESVEHWRDRFVTFAVLAIVLAMPLAMVAAVPVLLDAGLGALLVLDVAVWLWGVWTLLRASRVVRAGTVMAVLYVMLVSFLVAMGPGEARPAWLVGVPVMAALLFGARAAAASVLGNLVLLLVLYHGVGPTLQAWQPVYAAGPERFRLFAVSTTVLAAVASLPIGFLLEGLEAVLRKERELRSLLAREHRELEAAHDALLEEMAERERLERDLRQAQKLEALGNLAGGVAHDLNNFLMPIRLYTEMVRGKLADDSREHHQLGRVLEASERAKELVARVLAFSRKVPPPDAYVDPGALLREQAEALRARLPSQVRLELHADGQCDPVFANHTALSQVISNLTANALHAMPGGGTLTLSLGEGRPPASAGSSVSDVSGWVGIEVRDTGVGMDAETAERIFEPFFTTRQMGEGTGLGLATAHGIVASLGGHIELQTAPGAGSCFTVHLPTRHPAETLSDAPSVASAPARFSGHVLLVDDEPEGRRALRIKLTDLGLDVETASSVPLALDKLRANGAGYDLLISDNQMPGMSGLELLQEVRAAGWQMPIMLITGFPDREVLRAARQHEVAAVIAKPFGHEELVRGLGQAIGAAGEEGTQEGRARRS
jgi:signal transduction histidine kinase/CheY-like chemotaxis protein